MVEVKGDYLRVVGRTSDVINVGGQKILPGEIERVALLHPAVELAAASGGRNPITGEHVEVLVQAKAGETLTREDMMRHFRAHLPPGLQPHRVRFGEVAVGHRFKRL